MLAALNEAKVPFVILGEHALAAWINEPRVAQKTEVFVPRRWQHRAVQVLGTALRNGTGLVDVLKPVEPLHGVMFKHTRICQGKQQAYRIPSVEALVSPYRRGSMKHRDAYEFALLMQCQPKFNRDTLRKLGELVYRGGGAGILTYVRKTQAEEKPIL